MIRRLFEKTRDVASKKKVDGPEATRAEHESVMKEIFDEYAAQLRGEAEKSPTLWIFQKTIDHESFLQMAVALIDEAEMRGRRALSLELANKDAPAECSCRCRAHMVFACARCLRVEKCQAHVDPNPAQVLPRRKG